MAAQRINWKENFQSSDSYICVISSVLFLVEKTGKKIIQYNFLLLSHLHAPRISLG